MFFILINIKKFEIRPYRFIEIFFVLKKLKCVIFGSELDLNEFEFMRYFFNLYFKM